MSSQKALQLLKTLSEYTTKSNGYDKVLQKVKFVAAQNGNCTAELKVDKEHLNAIGGLHGGFIATLVDSVSTFALMTKEDDPRGGVSVDIHVSYLKGAREGDEIVIDAKTIRAGKTLAFLEVEIKNKETNEIIAKGSHTKYVLQK